MKVTDHPHLARGSKTLSRALLGLRRHGALLWGCCLPLAILNLPVEVWADATTPDLQVGQRLGETARELSMLDVTVPEETAPATLDALRGSGGLLLVFSSNTCPYVLDWLDRLPRLAARGSAAGVPLVVVNANERRRRSTDAPEAMLALWRDHGFSFPYLVDQDAALADALNAQRTPEVFLFDGDWTLVYRGAIDDLSGPFDQVTQHYADDALEQMLDGKPILQPTSDAVGCAIQRPRRRVRSSPNSEE